MAKNKKNKKQKNNKDKVARNPVVEIARARNSAGPMQDKRSKRQRRNSWKKDVEAYYG